MEKNCLYLDHGLLKIRPNMTPTDFEKCRFCLFVGSSSDIMFIHSHILSYMWVRRWFDIRIWPYWPPAFSTKVPKYHALINPTDFLYSWWYLIIRHIYMQISMIFAPAVLQISAPKDVCHFTLVPWYLEIRRVLHCQKLSTTVNVTYHVTRLIIDRLMEWYLYINHIKAQ